VLKGSSVKKKKKRRFMDQWRSDHVTGRGVYRYLI
jgi:hypothetical protein